MSAVIESMLGIEDCMSGRVEYVEFLKKCL